MFIQVGSHSIAVASRNFLFHQRKIPPKVLKTVCAAEKRGEVRWVHADDIAGALLIRRHRSDRTKHSSREL